MPKLRSKDPRRRLASRFSGSRLALLAPPAGSRRWARRIDECVDREAFPEYSDLSDSDLIAKTLTAHPAFRTWIREETDGSPPLAVAIRGQPTNYRLKPPPRVLRDARRDLQPLCRVYVDR